MAEEKEDCYPCLLFGQGCVLSADWQPIEREDEPVSEDFEVALWSVFPSVMATHLATVEAPSAFAAIETFMHYVGSSFVAYASAWAGDGRLCYRAFCVRVKITVGSRERAREAIKETWCCRRCACGCMRCDYGCMSPERKFGGADQVYRAP